jgi:hypothetical protein
LRKEPRPPTYSTARLDSLVCPVMVDSRQLQACLPAAAQLSLPGLPYVSAGQHPILIEIWLVQDGLIEVGGLTAHRLWELAGGAAGLGFGWSAGTTLGAGIGGGAGAANGAALGMWFGPLGWWWGATAGAATGAALGATIAATTGAVSGASWAAEAGRRTSELNSRVIGTYNEIIVTVPCRLQQPDGQACDVAFVLGTYTDSVASMLGESIVGWGYRKSQAYGRRTRDGALEVKVGPSREPFRVVRRQMSPTLPPSIVRSTTAAILASLSLPLLGRLPPDRLMVSFLDRRFEEDTVRVTPAAVRLESGDAFLPGLPGFEADVNAVGGDDPWGAFLVTGLPVTLSYPRSIDE